MRTTELETGISPTPPVLQIDAPLVKWLIIVNGLIPLLLLGWDAADGSLGANGVNFAIHTTGMVGLVLLMLSLAVTPIRRMTGWSTIVAARRPLGVLSFIYLAIHFGIFFVFDRDGSVSSTIEEVLSRTYLQIGTIALVLMAALALTSTDRMVSLLGPRRWKLLHRLTYPIAIMAVIHFILLVKSDLRAPRAFAVLLGLLLLYRVVVHYRDLRARSLAAPARRATPRMPAFWRGELSVIATFDETPDVRTFRLAPADGSLTPFVHAPGQYLNVTLDIDGRRIRRSYTIASAPGVRDYCEITVKRASDGYASHFFHDRVKVGDTLSVAAPAGRFVFDGAGAAREVLLIAGGVGITPMMSILRHLTARAWRGTIHVVVVTRRPADIIFRGELETLAARHPSVRLTVTLTAPDDTWTGGMGRLDAAFLKTMVPNLGRSPVPVFICGPDGMMEATVALVGSLGVPAADIATEAFVSPLDADASESNADLDGASDEGAPADVQFTRSDVTVTCAPDQTILEAAEEAGISLPYECRSGICGQCRTRVTAGRVAMASTSALVAKDRQAGYVLACQAVPRGRVAVDA